VDKRVFTVSQFCEAYGIGRTKLYQLFDEGRGPTTVRVGRRVLIPADAAETWLRQLEKPADNPASAPA